MKQKPFASLAGVVSAMADRRVLTVADLVVDEFVYGRVQRLSREAPVPILEYLGNEARPGGGANAINNLATLGGRPVPVGAVGRDPAGADLLRQFRAVGIPTRAITQRRDRPTPVKSRILAGGTHSTKQQLVRIDRIGDGRDADAERHALARLDGWRGRIDGILISDYDLGTITPRVVRAAVALARRQRIPITIDSRWRLLSFRGMTAATPNEPEVEAALGVTIGHDRRRLEKAGRTLLERLRARALLITRGSDGMALFEPERKTVHLPIFGSDEIADVTGAGDTVIAAFTLALAAGATALQASRLANYAGGIVVMKRGTATVSADELTRAVAGEPA